MKSDDSVNVTEGSTLVVDFEKSNANNGLSHCFIGMYTFLVEIAVGKNKKVVIITGKW